MTDQLLNLNSQGIRRSGCRGEASHTNKGQTLKTPREDWGKIGQEMIAFTQLSVNRTSTLKSWINGVFFVLFFSHSSSTNEKSSRRLVLQLQVILPKKLTVLKAL